MLGSSASVFFTSDIFRIQSYGGISRYIIELHRNLRRLGISSEVGSFGSISEMTTSQDANWCSIPRMELFPSPVRLHAGYLDDARRIRKMSPHTVIHKSYYGPTSSYRKLSNSPTAITVHDLVAERFPEVILDRFTKFKRENVHGADLLLTGSEHARGDIVSFFGVSPERVKVVHHGVNPPSENEQIDRSRLPSQFLIFVGHRDGYKNWKTFISAFGSSPLRHEFGLVNFGGPKPTQAEWDLIRISGLDDRQIHFLSGTDLELGALYSAAQMLVYPSLYEGFGLPPLEAMIRGCPVVTSGNSAIPEVVSDAAILVDSSDVSCLADGMLSAVESQQRTKLIGRGLARASLFSWENSARQTLLAYQSVLDIG
jgi:glycosyltransferase involved in cell wall biosynthesis